MEDLVSRWRKSSYSDNGGNCVEVGSADGIMVRDSKDFDGGTLAFPVAAWAAFTVAIKG